MMWIDVGYNQVLFTTNLFRLTGWKQSVKLWLLWRQFVWSWHCFDYTARNQWFYFKFGNLQQSSDCQLQFCCMSYFENYGTKTVFFKVTYDEVLCWRSWDGSAGDASYFSGEKQQGKQMSNKETTQVDVIVKNIHTDVKLILAHNSRVLFYKVFIKLF